jgi:crotonobetainyl-CoA:carnitine CoA-transferase CaiB-like acyl-CoA transferase
MDKAHVMTLLQHWGVPAGAALNPREIFTDPHLRSRGFWEQVEDGSAGIQEYYGRPYRFSISEVTTRTPTPQLGQHNHQILHDILGLSPEAIAELELQGTIGTQPVSARGEA